jgi:hypothetical protein
MKYLTTFKIFKYNFWTNPSSRFLYEGKYYKFSTNDVSKVGVVFVKESGEVAWVEFHIPRVWRKEYKNGVCLPSTEFPKHLLSRIEKFSKESGGKSIKKGVPLEKELEKDLINYFVKKVGITESKAKTLIKVINNDDLTIKEKQAVYKRVGLQGK